MRKLRFSLALVLVLLLLGCKAVPGETTPSETTVPETTVPVTTVPETTAASTVPETQPSETTISRDELRVGYYILEAASFQEEPLGEDVMAVMRVYIQIREGHAGAMYIGGAMSHLDWTNRFLIINGVYNPYTLKDDVITLTYDWDYTFVLRYYGEELPENYGLSPLEPGLYLLDGIIFQDGSFGMIEEPSLEVGYLLLRQDGTGLFFNGEETFNVDWSGGAIKIMSNVLSHFFLGPDEFGGEAVLVLPFPSGEILYYSRVNGDDYPGKNPGGADV